MALSRPTDGRGEALDLLRAVLGRGHPLDEALAWSRSLPALPARDRAFARLLVATVLRRLGQIDAVIAHCLDRPLPKKLARVHNVLRLGAAQLLFLGTPAYAAIDTGVALTSGGTSRAGLVNAVLRRIAREGDDLVAGQDAARLNTPDWLWQSWHAAYGEAVTRAIALAHLAEPSLDLSVKADPADWAARLQAESLQTGSLRLPLGGAVTDLPGYGDGAWWVQDAAAALPARLLGEVAGRRVLDLCAAPGGKTAQLAAAGARVTAVDAARGRAALLRENLRRLRLDVEIVAADILEFRPAQPFPLVLLDAPCTATGTIRRHPDVARLKTREDVTRMAALQGRLLRAAIAMLAPGGMLVYSVCSLQPEECAAVVEAALADARDLVRAPIASGEVGDIADAVTPAGDLRTLPCHLAAQGGMDGFYACRLRRTP